jgi:O-antigen/teichoic acid export membrane protein
MGKTLFARNLFTCILFSAVILATRNLIVTVSVTTLLSTAFCQLINTRAIKAYCPRDKRRHAVNIRRLFVLCFPIFVSTFMSLLLYNIPKYAIDTYLTEADQAYYNILYMPSFVVTLFSEIITKPVLTSIAASWNEDLRPFVKIVLRNFALIVAGSLVVVLAGDLIGRRLLEIFYGQDLTAYRWHFVVLLIGGRLSALVYVTYNILISIRAQRFIIIGYLIVAAISIPLTYMVVSRAGMWGAVWAYTLTCLGLEVLFFGALATLVLKRQKASA